MAEKLLDRMRRIIRTRRYSYRTEKSYLGWARRFILFHGKQHPSKLGKEAIEAFLSHLAVDRHVAPSTQNQALNGILFLYRHVLEMDVPWLEDVVRAVPRKRVPVVLEPGEVRAILGLLRSPHDRIVGLLYGSGLRINEALRLRVKDIDFKRRELVVRSGKGDKDRVTVLADRCVPGLQDQVEKALVRSAGGEGCGAEVPNIQACDLPCVPAFVRDPSARKRCGYSHGAATARPFRRTHDHDLHACHKPGWPGGAQPDGSLRAGLCRATGYLPQIKRQPDLRTSGRPPARFDLIQDGFLRHVPSFPAGLVTAKRVTTRNRSVLP